MNEKINPMIDTRSETIKNAMEIINDVSKKIDSKDIENIEL